MNHADQVDGVFDSLANELTVKLIFPLDSPSWFNEKRGAIRIFSFWHLFMFVMIKNGIYYFNLNL